MKTGGAEVKSDGFGGGRGPKTTHTQKSVSQRNHPFLKKGRDGRQRIPSNKLRGGGF